jgi:hypothetical protein
MMDWRPKGNYKKTGRSLIGLQKPKDEEIRKPESLPYADDPATADYYLNRPNFTEAQKDSAYRTVADKKEISPLKFLELNKARSESLDKSRSELSEYEQTQPMMMAEAIKEQPIAQTMFEPFNKFIEGGTNIAKGKVGEGVADIATGAIHGVMTPFTVPYTAAETGIRNLTKDVNYKDPLTKSTVNLGDEILNPVNRLMNLPFDVARGGGDVINKGLKEIGVDTKKISKAVGISPELDEKLNNLLIEIVGLYALKKGHDTANKYNKKQSPVPTEKTIPKSEQVEQAPRLFQERFKTEQGLTETIPTEKPIDISKLPIDKKAEYQKARERAKQKFTEEKTEIIPEAEKQTSDLPSSEELSNVKQKEVQTTEKIGGNESAIQRMLSENKTPEDISKALNVPIEEINQFTAEKTTPKIDKRKLFIKVTGEMGQYPLNSLELGKYRNEELPTPQVMNRLKDLGLLEDVKKQYEKTPLKGRDIAEQSQDFELLSRITLKKAEELLQNVQEKPKTEIAEQKSLETQEPIVEKSIQTATKVAEPETRQINAKGDIETPTETTKPLAESTPVQGASVSKEPLVKEFPETLTKTETKVEEPTTQLIGSKNLSDNTNQKLAENKKIVDTIFNYKKSREDATANEKRRALLDIQKQVKKLREAGIDAKYENNNLFIEGQKIYQKEIPKLEKIEDVKIENKEAEKPFKELPTNEVDKQTYLADVLSQKKFLPDDLRNMLPKGFGQSKIDKAVKDIREDAGAEQSKEAQILRDFSKEVENRFNESGYIEFSNRQRYTREEFNADLEQFMQKRGEELGGDTSFEFGENIKAEPSKTVIKTEAGEQPFLSSEMAKPVFRTDKGITGKKNIGEEGTPLFEQVKEDKGQISAFEKPVEKRVVSQEKYEQARKNIISKAGQLNAGLDPTMLKDLTIVGAYHFENGVRSFADYSQKMVEEFGEKVKPYLKDIWDEMKKEIPELKEIEKPKVIVQPEKIEGFIPEYGEAKTRGASKSTLAIGIANDITDGIKNLPTYDVKRDAPQIEFVSNKIATDMPTVEKWLSGEEAIPKDLNTGFIRRGVESYAIKTNNYDLFEKLTKSEGIAKSGTEAGQEVRSFRHDEEYSGVTTPYDAVKEISKERGEQGGRAKELSNKYKTKIRDLEAQLKLKDEQLKEQETQRLIDQERKRTYRDRKAGRSRTVEVLEKEYDDLIKSFAKEMTMNVGFNPEQIVLISKMITNRVEKGMVKAVDVIDNVYISLKDKVEGLKKDDIIDAYLYGNKGRKPQTKNELSVSIADLRRQLETIKKIELLESGEQPFRKRFEKNEPSEPLQQLKDNLKALEDKKRQELKEKNRPQKEIDDRVKQLQKQIDLVNSKIDGTYVKPEAKPKPQTPETIKKEKELADSRQQLKDNLKALGITEQQNLARSKELIKKRIDEYNEKINKGDYVKEDKTPAVDDEKRKLKSELEDVRKKWNDINKNLEGNITPEETKKIFDLFVKETELKKKMEESGNTGGKGKRTQEEWAYGQARVEYAHYIEELKNNINAITLKHLKEDPYGITKKFAKETPGMMKSIAATLDDSAVFNPGVRVLWNNPTIWARNSLKTFRDMYRVWGGKNVFAEIGAYVASSREFENALKDKVAVNVIEEAFPASQLLEKVPFLGSKLHKAADAAYTGWMFRNRMDLYEHFADVAQKNGYKDPTGLGIGKFVNSLTGRGNLGKYEKAADVFNVWFFSPRRVKSHWDVLTAHAFDKEVSPFMKKQAAYSLLKIVGGTATVLTLAKAMGADVEIDPRSSDFGKIKIGNTRFDISGGMTSLIVLAARLAAYTTDKVGIADIASLKDSDGDLTKLGSGNWGDTTAWDKVLLFGTNKFSPAAAITRDFLKGQTFGGEKFSFKNAILNSVTPLPIQNFEEILKDPNSAPLVAALIADGLGIFTNTYSNDPDLRKVKNALLGADTKFSKEKKINFNVALNRALRKGVITKDQADEYRKEFLELQKDAKLPEKKKKFRDRFNKK